MRTIKAYSLAILIVCGFVLLVKGLWVILFRYGEHGALALVIIGSLLSILALGNALASR